MLRRMRIQNKKLREDSLCESRATCAKLIQDNTKYDRTMARSHELRLISVHGRFSSSHGNHAIVLTRVFGNHTNAHEIIYNTIF